MNIKTSLTAVTSEWAQNAAPKGAAFPRLLRGRSSQQSGLMGVGMLSADERADSSEKWQSQEISFQELREMRHRVQGEVEWSAGQGPESQ